MTGCYLAFPDKVYVFDGIMFAGIIERLGDDSLLNQRHLLFIPFMRLIYDALARVGLHVSAYSMIQRCNAIFGALGAYFYFRLVARLTKDWAVAAVFSLLLAFSYAYWSRATEGQVYMLMTLGALACSYSAIAFVEEPIFASGLALGLAFVAAVLFHLANFFLLPMMLAAFWLGSPAMNGGRYRLAAGLVVLAAAAPFALAFKITSPSAFLSFLTDATEFYSKSGHESWLGLLRRFFSVGGDGLRSNLAYLAREGAASLIGPSVPGIAWAGFALWGICGGALVRLLRRPRDRAVGGVLLFWSAGYVFLNVFWRGGQFFWAVPLGAGMIPVAMQFGRLFPEDAARPWPRRGALIACSFAVMLIGAWNLRSGIIPQNKIENNAGYMRSIFVGEHTVPLSWVIISGTEFPNAKVYLPYFAKRRRAAVEYYFNNRPKNEGLSLFRTFIHDNAADGIPLYFLSGFSVDADVQACFDPGHRITVSAQDPSFAVSLFVPRDHEQLSRLFEVLTYSYLAESDLRRLSETADVLRFLASHEMDPVLLRHTVAAMKSQHYGTALIWDGLISTMGPSFQDDALHEFERFAAWQKTSEFHQRMADLYKYIGLPEEVRLEERELARLKGLN